MIWRAFVSELRTVSMTTFFPPRRARALCSSARNEDSVWRSDDNSIGWNRSPAASSSRTAAGLIHDS
ncbi:hypothetical protein BC477_05180 [Clavibacter michiganensis subsp. michiganensis]|uniref:Uncharacterized protein n=1 Tax=Clavibacter michiganensis subsp. michiganensis TaxID=33013 RepID=A0A251XLP1_CLAMM|nr:hypothetical protein BC477_05180 [Clavibacter michiganensis subsp. michiganensis]OUE04109.1 hypothetical protein CMMCAS07_04110 [Clavibacter michiganensis subsp. michiganensis]